MERTVWRKIMQGSRKNDTEEEAKSVVGRRTNQYLTYDVLRIIFKYLNGMDLSSAAMVCRSWLEAANDERRTRGGPVCSIHTYEEYSEDQKHDLENIKTQAIKSLTIKPQLGLFFIGQPFDTGKEDCHCKVLPPNCNTVTLRTYGVVINNNEIEDNTENVVCAFLPATPDVKIRTFVFHETYSLMNDNIPNLIKQYREESKKSPAEPGQEHSGSGCLLWFCNLGSRNLARNFLNCLKRGCLGDTVSVWGGVATDLSVCTSRDNKRYFCRKYPFCVGITLVGLVHTWSIIVDFRCNSKEKVEERLQALRNRVQLRKHSMGFMFACCSRGQDMFREPNVESGIFKKLFPEVPLVGCFGDGEFGENTIPKSPNEETKWYNQTSTVFMILTYG